MRRVSRSGAIALAASLLGLTALAADPESVARRSFEPSGAEMVLVPGGRFEMGCAPVDTACFPDEKPRHEVKLGAPLWVDVTEVTVARFRAYARATGTEMPTQPPWSRDDHPVVNVAWADAAAYCGWAGGRLPTEAEWEHAARGGEPGRVFPWGNEPGHDLANYEGAEGRDRWNHSSPAASFPANGFGLFDAAGNVWEWCADWYGEDAFSGGPATDPAGPATDPAGPAAGVVRVLRGGAWNTGPKSLRLSNRGRFQPEGRSDFIGFRCVRDAGDELETPPPPPPVPSAPADAGDAEPVVAEPLPTPSTPPVDAGISSAPTPSAVTGGQPEPTGATAIRSPRSDGAGTGVPPSAAAATPCAGPRRFPPANDEMVCIPPMTVEIGCVHGDGDCDGDEQPRHEVTFARGFWIDATEVTAGAYARFAAATGREVSRQPEWSGDDHPVVNVTWNDAVAYCQWAGGRLPSEAEWEAAARGGVEGAKYSSGRRLDSGTLNADGVTAGDTFEKSAPVASFAANGFGLFDVAGNVWEWCADWYAPRTYADGAAADPTGPTEGSLRVVRGGSWTSNSWRLRLSYRFRLAPSETSVTLGFRCARDRDGNE